MFFKEIDFESFVILMKNTIYLIDSDIMYAYVII